MPVQVLDTAVVVVEQVLLRPVEQVARVRCLISLEQQDTMQPVDLVATETLQAPLRRAQMALVEPVEPSEKTLLPARQTPDLAVAAVNT
jgi:hypothetical protein